MYYTGSGEEGQSGIGRATADSPEGPWQREPEPILSDGPPGSWDDELILADQIVATEDGFLMYYSGRRRSGVPAMIGLATSDDGLSWEKYRDASGSEGGELYAESDPILLNGTGWDFGATWTPNVFQTDEGWIMFYNAFGSLGLAFSDDGIIWTRSEDNPIYTSGSLFHPFVVPLGDDSFQIYFRNLDGETIDVLNGTLVIP